MKRTRVVAGSLLASTVAVSLLASIAPAPGPSTQTAPPAPVLASPASGASVVQPVTLKWQPIVDPDGPIGSYSWQVSTSSTFGSVIASGFNNSSGTDIPLPTDAQVSGLANGTYFWRVKGAQDVGGVTGFIDSPFSAVRSFTVTGLGPAPAGIPSITTPVFDARFHPFETFDIRWTEVVGAHHYILEADDDSAFSHPITLSGGPTVVFGTEFHAGWGNEIPSVHYRVRAVSADNVWGRPSSRLTVHITNTAPVPPAPVPLAPAQGQSITLPFVFDWSDTANPQIPGYDIDIDDEPNFLGAVGVLLVTNISRSDCMVVPDPLVEGINHLPPGTYFWRVRALHGNAFGPWSAGKSFTVTASPPTPPGLEIFWILADPGSVQGGNSTAARIALNGPAPSGGALIHVASDFPGVDCPATVLVPAGATDALVSPITTPAVSGASIGDLRAAYGLGWQQSSIGCFPILWGGALAAENVLGGSTVSGVVTLLGPAPLGGVEVTLTSSSPALARVPATVFVPQGATGAAFDVTTSTVTVPKRIEFGFGTAFEGYGAPGTALVLMPAGSPAPPPAVSALTLSPTTVLGGGSGTGTVTLTAPAPAGGALIRLSGSMEGDVVVPASVTVPAGSMTASFALTPPPVARPHWVLIQASLGFTGLLHASTLRVDPGPPGPSPLFAIDARPNGLIGGQTSRGTVGLSVPAPPGGAVVSLVSSDTSVAQVPVSVVIAAGNSTASFTITTSSVASFSTASITATAGGASKTAFLSVGANPNAPLALLSITPSVSGAVGGNSINTTLFLNKEAPAGGAVVTLSSSNTAAARVPATVTVPAGLGFATLNITTSPVTVDTPVTITGTLGATRTAVITVLAPPLSLASLALNPTSVAGTSPSTGTVTLSATAPSGGTVVTLSSSNTATATVPASVTVAAGASSATFSVTTKTVASTRTVTITGSAGGVNRSATLTVTVGTAPPDTTAPTVSVSAPATGATVSGTVTISASASDNLGVARVEFLVDGTLLSTDTTAPHTASWNTTAATNGIHALTARAFDAAGNQATSAAILVTVNNGSPPVLDITLGGVPASLRRGTTFTATASVANTGSTAASGYTVLISFTPTDSMRLESPQSSSQSLAAVAAGGTQSVSWQLRADRTATATLTMTLRNSSGATVDTASRSLTITD